MADVQAVLAEVHLNNHLLPKGVQSHDSDTNACLEKPPVIVTITEILTDDSDSDTPFSNANSPLMSQPQHSQVQRRTYHTDKSSQYALPNDTPEHHRLDRQARCLDAIMNGEIVHAQIQARQIRHALDVGCGTGPVTHYLGRKFPHAKVVGLDISAVPESAQRPPNVQYLQGNVLTDRPDSWRSTLSNSTNPDPLPQDQRFDLIFSRLLIGGMSDWPAYIRKCYNLLQPGGSLEIHDMDWKWFNARGDVISDSWPWLQTLFAAGRARGLDFNCGRRARKWMVEAGFHDVHARPYKCPHGGQWEKDQAWKDWGDYIGEAKLDVLELVMRRFLPGWPGVNDAAVEHMVEEMRWDLRREEGKYCYLWVTYARKA